MAEIEKRNTARAGQEQVKSVPWADCGAVAKIGNAHMEPSRLHWTCHCRCRPKNGSQSAFEQDEQ